MNKPETILEQMTLEEKADLCSGKDYWHLYSNERLGIPEVMVCDGPHGLRKKDYSKTGSSLNCSVKAVCFPTASCTANSWDPDLLYEMGEALGRKCQKEDVGVLLGPGINMKRNPLCGRNFEYFSEDPVLAGNLAAGFINGVQSTGVGTSLKHFCANSQETRRMTIDSVVDERALREIYLTAFEIAVKKSHPYTVMNSYNKINGVHGSENAHTQNEILRDEWGYEGTVVSDWGAVNNRALGLKNGNDIEMPGSKGYGTQKILDAVESGELTVEELDKAALRILRLIKKCNDNREYNPKYDEEPDHMLARKIAGESMVLLKNDGILPLDKTKKIAVIGDMADHPRYQGAGSSQINPTKLDSAFDELFDAGCNVYYAQGYETKQIKAFNNQKLCQEAVDLASQSDIAVVFVGLTDEYESEGFDRQNMFLPPVHNRLVREILKVNPNVIVVLAGGAPVEIPWADNVRAILHSFLGGQASGGAVADILTGKVNPSGKLAETYPMCTNCAPSNPNFPGGKATVEYRESIYIGYRYYEKVNKKVRYPFGFGLSYTSFEYSDLTVDKKEMNEGETLTVKFTVRNTGKVAGAEIAQVYVKDKVSTIFRPEKELKAFKKVYLEPGEEKEIELTLGKRAFAFFNVNTNDWCVEDGEFEILVAASSADIRLTETITVHSNAADIPDYTQTAPVYYTGEVKNVSDNEFTAILGREIPPSEPSTDRLIDITDTFESACHTKNGKIIFKIISTAVPAGMARSVALQTPFRNFVAMSGGAFNQNMADGLLKILNSEKGGAAEIVKEVPGLLKGIGPILNEI
ncbi:MAG: glycoside hydrolase family 3 C-terminal domain-containing protein [Clostridiales bacterium]|nr:glycoside hydrolase family 3 C-terminal domain-containing protein [Clostridiales bacterium]